MKVAIVVNTSWNVYNFRLGLIRALIDQGSEVHAIAPRDEYSEKLRQEGCIYHALKMDSRGAHPLKDMALTFELYRLYKKIKPDVVLHYTIKPNIYGSFAAAFLNIPAVNNVCGLGTAFLQKNMVSRVAIMLYKLAFRFPKKIFFQNEHDQSFFIENKIVRKSTTGVLPGSGIDLKKFIPNRSTRNNKFTFLLVSRLIHDKGILEYIQAIEILKKKGVKASYQLLGKLDPAHRRGIAESLVNQWIDENRVEYLGSTDDVRPFLNHADCVVLPSYREGTPRTLLEAASSGKPLVATNVPGCNNVVHHEFNGLLCDVKDARDLAAKMYQMTRMSQQQLDQMGENGRKLATSRFDQQLVIDRYLSTLASL